MDKLGFQKLNGPEPFSEDRPMRVGCLEHGGRRFQTHAQVIAIDSEEYGELVSFRERLRRDPSLRLRYEERKRAILANGIRDSLEYCHAKANSSPMYSENDPIA